MRGHLAAMRSESDEAAKFGGLIVAFHGHKSRLKRTRAGVQMTFGPVNEIDCGGRLRGGVRLAEEAGK